MTNPAGLRQLSIAFIAVLLFALACGEADSEPESTAAGAAASSQELEPKNLTFMAGFKPQANLPFVGAYVAQEKGFFDELNLDVDIRHAQSGEHLQLLLAGEVQVSTANAAQVVLRNSEDLPVVSVALVGQQSEQGFAVGADSGIESVSDWEGKRFGYKGSVPVEFLAVAQANGLDPDTVDQVKVSFDPRVLSEGQVDILAVFVSNEPGQLERIGYPVHVFDPSDDDVAAMGLTYIASRDGIAEDPEAIGRFVRGALRGITYAAENPEEALDIVMQYAPQENPEQQEFMLSTELSRATTAATGENGYGWQTQEQWQALSDMLASFELTSGEVDVTQIFTMQFLSEGD